MVINNNEKSIDEELKLHTLELTLKLTSATIDRSFIISHSVR